MRSVFAVVVTYNGSALVPACLESLRCGSVPVEVVVVDNASHDESCRVVRAGFPQATILPLTTNLGFGRGNNIGIKHAYDRGATHVLLLNQDATVAPATVEQLCCILDTHPEYGLVSPVHLDGSGSHLDLLFARHLCTSETSSVILSDLLLGKPVEPVYPVSFVNAAVWLISRTCLELVGLFNPAFAHYGEDSEYAHRVGNKGRRVGLVPAAHAYHNRAQVGNGGPVSLERFGLMERAQITYRLCRARPGTLRNLMSAASRIALSKVPLGTATPRACLARAELLGFLVRNAACILARRNEGYRGERAFFADADTDLQTFARL